MKKLLVALFVALLMVGCRSDGKSRKDIPESNRTYGELVQTRDALTRLSRRHIAVVYLQHEDRHCGGEDIGPSMTQGSVPMPV